MSSGALDYVRSFDEYGQPISLNYQGSEVFQTLLGGLLSILVLLVMMGYGILRFDEMIKKKDWTVTQ